MDPVMCHMELKVSFMSYATCAPWGKKWLTPSQKQVQSALLQLVQQCYCTVYYTVNPNTEYKQETKQDDNISKEGTSALLSGNR